MQKESKNFQLAKEWFLRAQDDELSIEALSFKFSKFKHSMSEQV